MSGTPIPTNMARVPLSILAELLSGEWRGAVPGEQVALGVTIDSRRVAPGMMFVAIRGETFDGHHHIDAAFAAGAIAIVCERDVGIRGGSVPGTFVLQVASTKKALGRIAHWWRLQVNPVVVAVTGSVGKTTTKDLIQSSLTAMFAPATVAVTQGNLNNDIGLPMTLLAMVPETRIAVVEIGMNRPGEISMLSKIAVPDIAVITSVAAAHTEGVGSIEGVAREKAAIRDGLTNGGVLIAHETPMLDVHLTSSAHLVERFGSSAGTLYRLMSARLHESAIRGEALSSEVSLLALGHERQFTLGLLGQGAAMNAVATYAVLSHIRARFELPESSLKAGCTAMSQARPAKGRLALAAMPEGGVLIDDSYNASPASMKNAISLAQQISQLRKLPLVIFLGEMLELGALTATSHQEVFAFASSVGAQVVTVGEGFANVSRGQVADANALPRHHCVDSEAAASLWASLTTRPAVVLVKGSRGSRMERVIPTNLSRADGSKTGAIAQGKEVHRDL